MLSALKFPPSLVEAVISSMPGVYVVVNMPSVVLCLTSRYIPFRIGYLAINDPVNSVILERANKHLAYKVLPVRKKNNSNLFKYHFSQ